MVDRGLERRGEDEPEPEACDRPDDRGKRPDDGAVRQHHETEVLPRGADGGEHAELAEPSLRDDCESCGGNQRCQEEEDGGHGEHRQRLCGLADVVPLDHGARIGRAGAVTQGPHEGVMLRLAPIDEQVDHVRAGRRGRDESELVAQLARVLDDADDGPSPAVEGQGRPDLEPQRLRHPVGDGDLAGPHRVATASEREQLAAIGAARGL